MIRSIGCSVILLIILFASPWALASTADKSAVELKHANTPALFTEQANRVRKDIDEGKRYGALRQSERTDVLERLERMQGLLEKSGSTNDMNNRDRTALFNDQEAVNGILLRNDQDRLVCGTERRTGSNMPTKVCRTVREMTEDRVKGREALEELQSRRTMAKGS